MTKNNIMNQKCPKCGIITYFANKKQRNEMWVGVCVACALTSGNFKLPSLPKWKQNLILVKHGLKREGERIVKVYE